MNTKRTPEFYLANLGSEVPAIFSAAERGDSVAEQSARKRAERIIADYRSVEKRPAAIQEVKIILDIIDDVCGGGKTYAVSKEDMEAYFMPFALKVLYGRGEITAN